MCGEYKTGALALVISGKHTQLNVGKSVTLYRTIQNVEMITLPDGSKLLNSTGHMCWLCTGNVVILFHSGRVYKGMGMFLPPQLMIINGNDFSNEEQFFSIKDKVYS